MRLWPASVARALALAALLGGLLMAGSSALPARTALAGPSLPPLGPRGILPAGPLARAAVHNQPVEIRMMVVLAGNQADDVDAQLGPLRRHLTGLPYKSYKLMFHKEMSLRPGATRSLGLFDGKAIEVTLISVTPHKATMNVKMYNPRLPSGLAVDTTVSVARKGTFFIGGPRYMDGVLLLPITAWY